MKGSLGLPKYVAMCLDSCFSSSLTIACSKFGPISTGFIQLEGREAKVRDPGSTGLKPCLPPLRVDELILESPKPVDSSTIDMVGGNSGRTSVFLRACMHCAKDCSPFFCHFQSPSHLQPCIEKKWSINVGFIVNLQRLMCVCVVCRLNRQGRPGQARPREGGRSLTAERNLATFLGFIWAASSWTSDHPSSLAIAWRLARVGQP